MRAREEACVGSNGGHVEERYQRFNLDTDSCYFGAKPHLIEFLQTGHAQSSATVCD